MTFCRFLIQKSTWALIGAFLIHVTLGTVYTLSNVNSYLTSYMRKHGSQPNLTYAWSLWLDTSFVIGQGLAMVFGGYLEQRFSARLACFIGISLHSLSIASTSQTLAYSKFAVIASYGFLPGFGSGMAYMTPMSNGFAWFPENKGKVAGVILAGYGLGSFVFNMVQTKFVNPDNLSPLPGDDGYFTQEAILQRVPALFIFLGCVYGLMSLVGCCLLFKPSRRDAGQSSSSTENGEHHNIKAYDHDHDHDHHNNEERPLLSDYIITTSVEQNCALNNNNNNGHCISNNNTASTTTNYSHLSFKEALLKREYIVLLVTYTLAKQGIIFVNSMLKQYAQPFIDDDFYLAWVGSMGSVANAAGRLAWGLAIDQLSFKLCLTLSTGVFGIVMFLMPFEFVIASKLFYLLGTLALFGSFSGWTAIYPVHLSRLFGLRNSGMLYGVVFFSHVSKLSSQSVIQEHLPDCR